jgi:hypothetical protein
VSGSIRLRSRVQNVMKKTGAREKIWSSRRGRSLITVNCSGSRAACNGSSSARDTRATPAGEAGVPPAKIFVHFARANPLPIKNDAKGKQDRREGELRLERDMKMKCPFLIGILCGVMLAAGVTFALTIPANNDHWRVEIVKRGGAAWYVDKNGNFGWMWTVQPISDRGQSGPHFLPHPRRASNSSLERL